jgi:hypothetical protein
VSPPSMILGLSRSSSGRRACLRSMFAMSSCSGPEPARR